MKKLSLFISIFFVLTLTCLAFTLPGCASKGVKSLAPPLSPKSVQEVSVMVFNVENLFDDKHDKDREDFTFLPLAEKNKPEVQAYCRSQKGYYQRECLQMDWNRDVINKKLKNVAEVILSVDQNKGPDILILVEVENDRILGELNKDYLSAAGYVTQVLIEGPDERGIDVAVLSRLPLDGKAQLHKIPYVGKTAEDQKWMNRSRGILEVPLKLPNGSQISVFAAHFPSQRNPLYWRTQSVEFAKKLLKEKGEKLFVMGGDFNITYNENEETGFFSKEFSEVGLVSHIVGCKSCNGTHNFRNDWSFLDALIFSKNMSADGGTGAYKLDPKMIDVVKYTENHIYKGNAPKRFNKDNGEGVSDHFPVYGRIQLRDVPPSAAETK